MKSIYKVLTLVLTFSVITSCTDSFEEINTDPNEPLVVPAENLFTQGQFRLSNLIWGRALNFEFGMLMVQHFSQNEYAEDSRYNQTSASFTGLWRTFYSRSLNDLVETQKIVEADEVLSAEVKNNQLAQIMILKALAFQVITDFWGDVPYTEAFQPEEFPNPAYDTQESIYSSLIETIDQAISLINTSAAGFSGGDVMYGGDMTQWGKFANSLKIRIAMRMVESNATVAAEAVSEAFASSLGVISSNDENALFAFQTDQRIANPFFVDAITRDDFCVSQILVQNMGGKSDPRLAMYADTVNGGEIVGLPYGLTDGESFSLKGLTSRPHPSIKEATAPAKLMTYAEVEFFRAEAIQRSLIDGSAGQAFNNAVTASMLDWGLTSADAAAYLASNPYDAVNWEQSIGYEKWVALYTQGVEAWSERRRLDQPVLPVSSASLLATIPVRAFYPAAEQEANNSNLQAVGVNDMTTRLWWDVD